MQIRYKVLIMGIALFVACITFATYIPSLQNGFVNWDDNVYVYQNRYLQLINSNFPKFLKWLFTDETNPAWHPLTLLSIALDYKIWGLNPYGYHLTNIIFHTLNTLLVFMLTVRLVESYEKALFVGFITSLLFGIHPLRVESVVWISERKDVLFAFFYLLSLLSYLKYIFTYSKRRLYYCLSLIFSVCAMMSKPMAVSLPIALLILDFYPLGRLTMDRKGVKKTKDVLIEKLPFFFFAFLLSLITIFTHWSDKVLIPLEEYQLTTRFIVAIHSYMSYLVKIVLPFNLAPLYPYPSSASFFTLKYMGSFTLFTLITYFAIRQSKKEKLFLAAWAYYIITLTPTIGIVQVGTQAAADRFTYLPGLGPFLLAGIGISILLTRFYNSNEKHYKIILFAVLILVFGIMANKTIRQISIWRDSVTFWSYEINLYPSNYVSYYNRGEAFLKLDNYEQAVNDFSRVVEINPEFTKALYSRGIAHLKLGQYGQAINDFSIPIELDPKFISAYNVRGIAYKNIGNYQKAIEDFNKAIELNPSFAGAFYNLGSVYMLMGESEKAQTYDKKAVTLDRGILTKDYD